MNEQTDSQLLRDYAGNHSEAAFTELVRRHLDFVYSAALRMVCDSHLAEDVTQGVFMALAKSAAQLSERPVLSGWLHRTAQNIAAQTVRTIERRRAREQEATAMNQLLSTESDTPWQHIAPHLDAALGELSESDRDALLLRYFERKSAREMARTLNTTEDAAQKRVSRAVERLREFFAKRGVTVGTSGLVVVISANAVQAAPVGLAVTISTAAVMAGTTIASTATAAAIKTIAMTTLQKTLITATAIVLAGAGIYEARQAAILREQNQTLQQQQAPLAEQIQQLQRERDAATAQLAALRDEVGRLNRNPSELLKLRGEVAQLRRDKNEAASQKVAEKVLDTSDPNWQPNWNILRPFDLAQFSDSQTNINDASAMDVGTATPAALLQTWTWAHRTGNTAGILKTRSFPEGTTEAQKLEWVKEVQQDIEYGRQHPETIGHSVRSRLRDLYSLGNDRYLALIEGKGMTTGTWVSHQFFSRIGGEWRVGDK